MLLAITGVPMHIASRIERGRPLAAGAQQQAVRRAYQFGNIVTEAQKMHALRNTQSTGKLLQTIRVATAGGNQVNIRVNFGQRLDCIRLALVRVELPYQYRHRLIRTNADITPDCAARTRVTFAVKIAVDADPRNESNAIRGNRPKRAGAREILLVYYKQVIRPACGQSLDIAEDRVFDRVVSFEKMETVRRVDDLHLRPEAAQGKTRDERRHGSASVDDVEAPVDDDPAKAARALHDARGKLPRLRERVAVTGKSNALSNSSVTCGPDVLIWCAAALTSQPILRKCLAYGCQNA